MPAVRTVVESGRSRSRKSSGVDNPSRTAEEFSSKFRVSAEGTRTSIHLAPILSPAKSALRSRSSTKSAVRNETTLSKKSDKSKRSFQIQSRSRQKSRSMSSNTNGKKSSRAPKALVQGNSRISLRSRNSVTSLKIGKSRTSKVSNDATLSDRLSKQE